MTGDYAGRPCQKRDPPHHPTLRPHDLAALERVSSTKSCRNENALKDKGIKPCILGRKSRGKPVKYDKRRTKRRKRIEIIFGRLKD
jgi:hypothetical protein